RLSTLDETWSGTVHADGDWRDATSRFALHLKGDNVEMFGQHIARLALDATGKPGGDVDASLNVSDWRYRSYPVGSGTLTLKGPTDDAELSLAWDHPDAHVELVSSVSAGGEATRGEITSALVRVHDETWRPDKSVSWALGQGAAHFEDHCWQDGGANVCFENARLGDEIATLAMRMSDLPVELTDLTLAPDVSIAGKLSVDFSGAVDMQAARPSFSGRLDVNMPSTSIDYFSDQHRNVDLSIHASVDDNHLVGKIDGTSDAANFLRGNGEMPDVRDLAKVKFLGQLQTSELGLVTAFVPQLDKAAGSLDARVDLDTTQKPAVSDVAVRVTDDASVVIPVAGITLSNLQLSAHSRDDEINVRFEGKSGGGTLTATGVVRSPLTSSRSFAFDVKGDAFEFLHRQDMTVVASPDLKVDWSSQAPLGLAGKLKVLSGQYRVTEIGPQARSVSPDVVVVGRDQAAASDALNLNLDVSIEQFRVEMYGLTGGIEGGVLLTEKPGSPRRATGNVNLVDGTFSRFGQTFSVERGRLIFSGPLNNPLVDVVSTRTITGSSREDVVKVSLLLSGPANNIKSSITASPSMSEAQALSYLVTGRPLGAAGSSDSNALSNAAIGLGLRQAAPITDEIRNSLGLSELTVSAGVDSASVIAGKRLSDELYVEYNYDVFSRIGGILFNYQLTPRLSLETRTGEANSMQLIYTF
ncbi:MAG: translocation/assembly module TamB domain-containing protein, partial [Pseudomonadales bacterium]|nr:translocation/assembly module TamB domain-containing protein [Pseudomonadales bacterium]